MATRSELVEQIPHALATAEPLAATLGTALTHKGKVRDNFVKDGRRFLVVSDRISAFDRSLGVVPFKGEVLTAISSFWFKKTEDLVPNHLLAVPDPQVMVAREAPTIKIEVVVRSHLTGSLWRDYQKNREGTYGLNLPEGLTQFAALGDPIITPSTKASYGEHDEPISPSEILKRGLCTREEWQTISKHALKLFTAGMQHASERGLILVDTKYEFGRLKKPDGSIEIIVIDEIHTPDCSRYWYKEDFDERLQRGEAPRALDKEFLRVWLMERGFSGEGNAPVLPDEVRCELAERYLELYRVLVGEELAVHAGPVLQRIQKNLKASSQ